MPPFLCVRAGALGDVLLLRQAVATLRAGGYAVWLLAPQRHASALLGPGGVQDVIDWEGPDVAALLRADGPCRSLLTERLRRCAGAVVYSEDASVVRAVGRIVTNTVGHPPLPRGRTHASAWYTQPVLGWVPHSLQPPPITATAAEARLARRFTQGLPRRFLAVHAGSGSPLKNWPAARFAAVVEDLARGQGWLLVEGPAEAADSSPLRALPGARLARELPPRLLGAVLARAGVYIGNDSGVSHLAAAWDTPTVTLFGPTNPETWAPIGSRVRVFAAGHGGLAQITVDEVIRAALEIRVDASRSSRARRST